ncbi:MAG: class I SAM-dependent methyltransferase [Blastocatellia bacterium]|jgi:phosphatidylethanolamine/phosphatidyl-N-methylethanolamine N-methyltransferase
MRRYLRTALDVIKEPVQAAVESSPRLASSRMAGPMTVSDEITFLQGFLRHPGQVGAVIPSSGFLERRLVRAAGIDEARCVVELGPGTGGTSRAILRTMRPDATLLAIELNQLFLARLTRVIDDPRFVLQLGSAEQIAEFLAVRNLPAPEVVVSGIPFSTMPSEVADRIARAVATVLAPGGRFVAYQVRNRVSDYVTPYLGSARREREMLNIPPVQIFVWSK